jgi:hypothetical protein
MGSVAWKIQNAMSGGPMAIARNATILDWPAAKGADPVKLRAGTNGWVCRPDNPVTPTNDPRCLDPNYQKLFSVPHGPERVALNTLGIGYMLQGGDAADMFDITAIEPAPDADFVLDGPHTMINISGDFDPSLVTADPSRGGPYVMFHGAPQEHLMIPTPVDQVMPSANRLWDAMSAAPLKVSENATVLDWPAKAGGDFVELRAGTNGWTCLTDNPSTPTKDPMCLDANWMEWIHAIMEGRKPHYTAPGIGYMLRGGSTASNTDPLATKPPAGKDWLIEGPAFMVVVPWDLDPAAYSTDPKSGGPYIMFEGTPYEYLMVPVQGEHH